MFAAETLIPRQAFAEFAAASRFGETRIRAFAAHLGIAPRIVLGRLQHEKLVDWGSYLNPRLKRRYKLTESSP